MRKLEGQNMSWWLVSEACPAALRGPSWYCRGGYAVPRVGTSSLRGYFYLHPRLLMAEGLSCQPAPSPGSSTQVGSWGTRMRVTPEHVVPRSLQIPRQPGHLWGCLAAWGAGSCFREAGLKENWLILVKYHDASAELCPPPASHPGTCTSTGGVIQGDVGRECPALHAASHRQGNLGAGSRRSGAGAWEAGWDTTSGSLHGGAQPAPMLGT